MINGLAADIRGTINNLNITVGTHDGVFHADEVCAVAVLRACGWHGKVVRSRADNELAQCGLILDVTPRDAALAGRVVDHHRHADEWLREDGTPYATAGIIWEAMAWKPAWELGLPEKLLPAFVKAVDDALFKGVDAADCGKASPTEQPTLSALISAFNADDIADVIAQRDAFGRAVLFAGQAIAEVCRSTAARLVKQAEAEAVMLPQAGNPVVVLEHMVPWKDVILTHWDAFSASKVIVYPDVAAEGCWRIQTLPGDLNNPFAQRCPAPKELWDKREGALGGQPLVFVHQNGFIGGVKAATVDEAVKAAEAWIAGSQA